MIDQRLIMLMVVVCAAGCGHATRAPARTVRRTIDPLEERATPPDTEAADRDALLTRRVRRALERDAQVAALADQAVIVAIDRHVVVRGIADASQQQAVSALVGAVEGVSDVEVTP